MAENVKSCPWCGQAPLIEVMGEWWMVKCDNSLCPVEPFIDNGFPTEADAIRRWNTRREGEG